MFLYYIPPPNKWQPHKAVKDSLGKNQIFTENAVVLKYIKTHLRWNLFCGFISVLLPWSLPASAKKFLSERKYEAESNIYHCQICVNAGLSGHLGSKSWVESVSINSICVTSVKCCVCCERSKATSSTVCLSLQTFCSGSQEAAAKYNEKEKKKQRLNLFKTALSVVTFERLCT